MRTRWAVLLWLSWALAGCAGIRAYSPEEARQAIRFRKELGYNGLGFWRGKLLAATGEGILEFDGVALSALYRWHQNPHGMIGSQGPWRDDTDGSLWFKEDWSKNLIRLGADGWTSIPMPVPRGDEINPVTFYSSTFVGRSGPPGFWLSSLLEAWQWRPQERRWDEQDLPPTRGGIAAVAPLGNSLVVVLWNDRLRFGNAIEGKDFESDTVAVREPGKDWRRVRSEAGRFATAELVATREAAFLRTFPDGSILRTDGDVLAPLPSPGACEAMARTTDGALLASFRGKGIYRYSKAGGWDLRHPCPYPPDETRHAACLAEDNGSVAFATSALRDPGPSAPARRVGTTALWLSRGGRLEKIDW